MNLIEVKHHRRAPWEVGKAGGEPGAGEVDGSPPPGLHPHMEHALHDDTYQVAPLRHGRRPTKRESIVLHLGVLSERMEGSDTSQTYL
jgi:hypothetical protein